MASNYEKGMYNQLMEVMARLDAVKSSLSIEKAEPKDDVKRLNTRINERTQKNQLLWDDNARLKSIINNDSSNTSLPPSGDQKGGKPANTYNGREKTGRKSGGQKGDRGTTLTRVEAEEKIKASKCRHIIKEIGIPFSKGYVTKYVLDFDVAPLIQKSVYIQIKGGSSISRQNTIMTLPTALM